MRSNSDRITERGRPPRRLIAAVAVIIVGAVALLLVLYPSREQLGAGVHPGRRVYYGRDLAAAADRLFVANALGHRRDRDAVPYLLPFLDDSNTQVRVAVAEALEKIADSRSTEALAARLEKEDDPQAATAVIRALGAMHLTNAPPSLVTRIEDYSPMVRMAAIAAVSGLIDSNVMSALARATADTNNSVRATAADAVERIGPAAIPSMLATMGDGSNLARIYRIAALGRIKSEETVPALVEVLRRHDPCTASNRYPCVESPVRVSVLDALSEIGETAAEGIARSEIGKPDDLAFKSFAAGLFMRLQSPAGIAAVSDRLLAWKTIESETEWKLWVDMLGAIDTPEARESLAKIGRHRETIAR